MHIAVNLEYISRTARERIGERGGARCKAPRHRNIRRYCWERQRNSALRPAREAPRQASPSWIGHNGDGVRLFIMFAAEPDTNGADRRRNGLRLAESRNRRGRTGERQPGTVASHFCLGPSGASNPISDGETTGTLFVFSSRLARERDRVVSLPAHIPEPLQQRVRASRRAQFRPPVDGDRSRFRHASWAHTGQPQCPT